MSFCFLYNVVSENHSVQNSPWGGGGGGGSIASSRSMTLDVYRGRKTTAKQQQHPRQNERKINKMRWTGGVAQRSDKSDIDVKHLSHLADSIASKILSTFRLFQLHKMFCVPD